MDVIFVAAVDNAKMMGKNKDFKRRGIEIKRSQPYDVIGAEK